MTLEMSPDEYQKIAEGLTSVAPEGWAELTLTFAAAAHAERSAVVARLADGGTAPAGPLPGTVAYTLRQLRIAAYREDAGTWFSATFVLRADGQFATDFDYDGDPGTDLSADLYALDLLKYPRTPEHTPAWLTAKLATRRVWAPSDEIELTADQHAVVERIVRSYADAAPAGWLRLVVREECSVDPGSAGSAIVRALVIETPDGLEQQDFRAPRETYFLRSGLLDELAVASPTRVIVFSLVVDRDGSHTVTVTPTDPGLLDGIRDETTSRPVHDYLANNREELERLAAATRAPAPGPARYSEGSSSRAWWILLGVCAAAWTWMTVAGDWVVATLLVGILGGVIAVAMWSTTYYSTTRLTGTALRAGSKRIRLADLDPSGVSAPGDPVKGKLFGAGWGAVRSPSAIRVTPRGQKPVWVQAKDPAALHAALVSAVSRPRTDA
ncbi:hypothetical protein Cch01nite_14910 [Cellulomonas chitinilytica]|uniref:Uncharacterized protein n=1 Tax=Cellulomonas chitinilytica TaxID=398759 RepID=A0A919U1R8_9CELL|nr:hypothetical protein [Cellulomonas chitinilytica]GIG20767.1 hypothetical protein Cch01nite_14910 [Cellulomonas chitinilytica]